jgi:hypothetical protein
MLAHFGELLAADGSEVRLDGVAAKLYARREDRELALALAAAHADGERRHLEPDSMSIS